MAINKHHSDISHESRYKAQQLNCSVTDGQLYSLTMTAPDSTLPCDEDILSNCCSDAIELNKPLQVVHAQSKKAVTIAVNERHHKTSTCSDQVSKTKQQQQQQDVLV